MTTNRACLLLALVVVSCWARQTAAQLTSGQVIDLSLLVSPDLPCVWPVGMTQHVVVKSRTFGPGAYHRDLVIIDEHTGTQFDAPAHFVPPPDSGLPGAGPTGLITCEKVPVWQFFGEACVIDVRRYVNQAGDGESFLIRPEIIEAWEKQHRPLKFGDVVLFRSDYSDKYYQPFPAGDRFVAQPLRKDSPGWPAPTPETMAYLGEKGVMTLGLDSPSMGPIPTLAAATHQAGGKLGMIWMECGTKLGWLPTTGAFYGILSPKHAGGSGSEVRALAITERKLAARLIDSARKKQVVDLSVTLDEEYPVTWPGYGPGDEASRYVAKTLNAFSKARGPYFTRTHFLDSQAGTHIMLPSYSLPPQGFDNNSYSPEIAEMLKKYEFQYGSRGNSSLTIGNAPLNQMMGEAHVIDVRELIGSAKDGGPLIGLDLIKKHEAQHPIQAGEVVIFYSGYSDQYFQPPPPAPELDRLMAAPLAGQVEGWPAPTPEVIAWLAEKGVRCIGTDGPTLGGVSKENALFVNWLAGSKGIFVVEFLTNVKSIAGKKAFFLFAPVKIKSTRAGYGRAVAFY